MSPHGQAQIFKETTDEYEKFKAIIFNAMGKNPPVRQAGIILKKKGLQFFKQEIVY